LLQAAREGNVAPATDLSLTTKDETRMSMWNKTAFAAMVFSVLPALGPAAAQTPSPAGAKVYFINLKDGDKVTSPFKVQFGLTGMGVAPAGVEKPNTGHHHLIIDHKLTDDELKAPLPVDDAHKHFGGGQTEAMVTLPPGKHTLQLVVGDWSHIPLSPPVMSEPITITVADAADTAKETAKEPAKDTKKHTRRRTHRKTHT
jgi:Domain of unknown function (DUF4399)